MPQSVPTPVAAALGLVPAVLGGVRRLPGRAVQLPVLAVGSALAGLDAARREYDDLAARGERLVARLRGTSFDELEDRVEDSLEGTAFARPYDAVEDALEDAGEAVAGTVSHLTNRVAKRTGRAATTARQAATSTEQAAEAGADAAKKATRKVADTAADKTGKATEKVAAKAEKATDKAAKKSGKAADKAGKAVDAVQDELPAAEQPKGEPTPQATQPDSTRVDTAATPAVVETVEQVSATASAPAVLDHDDLPLADYDHMTLGSLRGRLRSLTVEQLVQVRHYEKAHADRLPVVTMLDNRIAKLATDSDAEQPSGVPSDRPAPGQRKTRGGSKVSPATGGPAQNPPTAGVPTNPAQPRTTGSPSTNPNSNA